MQRFIDAFDAINALNFQLHAILITKLHKFSDTGGNVASCEALTEMSCKSLLESASSRCRQHFLLTSPRHIYAFLTRTSRTSVTKHVCLLGRCLDSTQYVSSNVIKRFYHHYVIQNECSLQALSLCRSRTRRPFHLVNVGDLLKRETEIGAIFAAMKVKFFRITPIILLGRWSRSDKSVHSDVLQ